MNSTLAAFVQSRPEGYLDSEDVKTLVSLDPLCPVLIRCTGGQLTCPAKDCAHFIALLERDDREQVLSVAITAQKQAEARIQRDLERAEAMVQRVIDDAVLFTEPCNKPVRCAIRGNPERLDGNTLLWQVPK